jgi:hypothetical protein
VRLRRLPWAIALGIPASLVGHALAFGCEHQVGGDFHRPILSIAIAIVAAFTALFSWAAWCGRSTASGSVLAARLATSLPSLASICIVASVAFAVCESVEPAHAAANPLLVAVALVTGSWVTRSLGRVAVRAIAEVVLSVARPAYTPRCPHYATRFVPLPIIRNEQLAVRRFARPPPIDASFSAA